MLIAPTAHRPSHSRAATAARSQIIDVLKEDHRRLKRAYREFQRLDVDKHGDQCESIVRRALNELRVHSALEEELLYPVLRPIVENADLVDEAEVEHETIALLCSQLESGRAVDDKFAARFVVLCEYVLHHVKEEEGELFPQLKRGQLDWEGLAAEFFERREILLTASAYDSLSGLQDELPFIDSAMTFAGAPLNAPVERFPRGEIGSITGRKL